MIYNEYIIVNIYKGNYKGISILNRTPIEVNYMTKNNIWVLTLLKTSHLFELLNAIIHVL